MSKVLNKVMDAVDVETYFACKSEDEAKKLSMELMEELGFKDVNIVFVQFQGPGARVRIRGYIYKPGDSYGWLFDKE